MKRIDLNREPVMIGGVVTAAVSALMMAVALGWIDLSDDQIGAVETFLKAALPIVAVVVPLVVNWFARQQVTPVDDPRTAAGEPAQLLPRESWNLEG